MERRHRGRPGRGFMILTAIFGIVAALSLTTMGVLFMSGVIVFQKEEPTVYLVEFYDGENCLYSDTYLRGAKLHKELIPTPSNFYENGRYYSFIGWDLTGSTFIDIVPDYVYGPIYATSVYSTTSNGGSK